MLIGAKIRKREVGWIGIIAPKRKLEVAKLITVMQKFPL